MPCQTERRIQPHAGMSGVLLLPEPFSNNGGGAFEAFAQVEDDSVERQECGTEGLGQPERERAARKYLRGCLAGGRIAGWREPEFGFDQAAGALPESCGRSFSDDLQPIMPRSLTQCSERLKPLTEELEQRAGFVRQFV